MLEMRTESHGRILSISNADASNILNWHGVSKVRSNNLQSGHMVCALLLARNCALQSSHDVQEVLVELAIVVEDALADLLGRPGDRWHVGIPDVTA